MGDEGKTVVTTSVVRTPLTGYTPKLQEPVNNDVLNTPWKSYAKKKPNVPVGQPTAQKQNLKAKAPNEEFQKIMAESWSFKKVLKIIRYGFQHEEDSPDRGLMKAKMEW